MRNPLRWAWHKVNASLTRDLAGFEAFTERKQLRKAKKHPSLEQRFLKTIGVAQLRPSQRLAIATYLAIMVFLGLTVLEALCIVVLHEFNWQLLMALTSVVTFIGGTYWGRHA